MELIVKVTNQNLRGKTVYMQTNFGSHGLRPGKLTHNISGHNSLKQPCCHAEGGSTEGSGKNYYSIQY